jgi:signal transduction histidine kinase
MLNNLAETFSNSGFMPHIHCYLGKPELVWTMFITDLLIGLAYVAISVMLWGLIRKIKIPFSMVILCFGIFIAACGATHFMEVYTLWNPAYWVSAFVKLITAIASVGTAIYLYRLQHSLVHMAGSAKLSEQRRIDLEALTNTLEQNVEQRTNALKEALQIRDDFLSVASHELRTPITALKLRSEINRRVLAKESGEWTERMLKFNIEMEAQVDRLTRLVEDMLDISRARSGTFSLSAEKIDLAQLLKSTIDRLTPTLDVSRIRLSSQIDPVLEMFGDLLRLEQVFSNLISNVARYAKTSSLLISAKKAQGQIEVVFEDTGPGIPREDSHRVFERFERLKPKDHSGGLGVGLYLSRSIIEAHRGTIHLDSKFKGARFVIILPCNTAQSMLDQSLSVTQNKK